jgi:WhiB family redox-sensing transcriptional regulator
MTLTSLNPIVDEPFDTAPSVLDAMMRCTGPLPELADMIRRPAWQSEAACRSESADLFFPTDGASLAAARRICAACPVAAECLEYALSNPSLRGIWAGTSERRRKAMRATLRAGSRSLEAV